MQSVDRALQATSLGSVNYAKKLKRIGVKFKVDLSEKRCKIV